MRNLGESGPLFAVSGMTQLVRETAGRSFNHSRVSAGIRNEWLKNGHFHVNELKQVKSLLRSCAVMPL